MSAFLGPIHHWLFNKINIQENLTKELLEFAEDKAAEVLELRQESYNKYGTPVKGNLEDIIEGDNIHGWLQERVTSAEYRLAYVVTHLIDDKYITIEEAKNLFRANGKKTFSKLEEEVLTPVGAYEAIFDSLLEGMPCDRVNEVITSNEDEVIWKVSRCIHEAYWNEVGGDIIYFYMIRNAWIEGFLEGTSMHYEKIEDQTYRIRK